MGGVTVRDVDVSATEPCETAPFGSGSQRTRAGSAAKQPLWHCRQTELEQDILMLMAP